MRMLRDHILVHTKSLIFLGCCQAWANSGLIAHHLTMVSLALATMAASSSSVIIDSTLELGGVSGAEGGWASITTVPRCRCIGVPFSVARISPQWFIPETGPIHKKDYSPRVT